MSTTVIVLNSSPSRWEGVPTPPDAMVIFTRFTLSVSDELGDGRGRNRRMHDHHARHAGNAGDRSNIANKIEIELVVQRRVDRVVAPGHEQRIAVRPQIEQLFGEQARVHYVARTPAIRLLRAGSKRPGR
jgi:hypothetical protein